MKDKDTRTIGLFVKGASKPFRMFKSQAEAIHLTGYTSAHISRCLAAQSKYSINGVYWRYIAP